MQKAENLIIKYKDTADLGKVIVVKANIYLTIKQYDSALYYCQKAIALGKKTNNLRTLRSATEGVGEIYISTNQPEKAIPWLQEAAIQNEQAKKQDGFINSYFYLGNAYYLLHDYKKAEKIMREVCTQSLAIGLKGDQLANAHGFLAAIYKQNKNYAKAYSKLEAYKQMEDSLSTKEKAEAVSQLDVKYRVAEKDKALAEKQLQLLKQQNNLKEKNIWIAGISVGALLLSILFISLFRNNQHKQKIRQLQAIMEAEERERSRIGQELHDGIGSMLTAANMNLGAIQKRHQHISEMKDFDEVTSMLQNTTTEIRKTSHNLMPEILLLHSLSEALHLYCEQINTGGRLQIELHFYGDLDNIGKSLTLSLYRIVQEFIQNIIKHADADKAVIQIARHDQRLNVTVEDNGVGFDEQDNNDGLGLQSLRKRVHALQGVISIESTKDIGTTAYVEFDLQKIKNLLSHEY